MNPERNNSNGLFHGQDSALRKVLGLSLLHPIQRGYFYTLSITYITLWLLCCTTWVKWLPAIWAARVQFLVGGEFLFIIIAKMTAKPTQPLTPWVKGALSKAKALIFSSCQSLKHITFILFSEWCGTQGNRETFLFTLAPYLSQFSPVHILSTKLNVCKLKAAE